ANITYSKQEEDEYNHLRRGILSPTSIIPTN
ncbi:unnamed protein product, partial [marine sediment metagenome]